MARSGKSLQNLLAQKAKIEDEIASLERQQEIESLAGGADFRKVAKEIARLGLTDEEILALLRRPTTRKSQATRSGSKKKTAPAAGVYQHPEDPSITWSGRGRKPSWIIEWSESGKSIEELRNA